VLEFHAKKKLNLRYDGRLQTPEAIDSCACHAELRPASLKFRQLK